MSLDPLKIGANRVLRANGVSLTPVDYDCRFFKTSCEPKANMTEILHDTDLCCWQGTVVRESRTDVSPIL